MHSTEFRNYQINSLILSLSMVSICLIVAWLAGGVMLLLEAVFLMSLLLIIAPYISPKVMLKSYQAQELKVSQANVLYQLVDNLSHQAGLLERPKIHYIQSANYIAFTVGGSKKAAIALSDGLLLKLNQRELNAVLAHEIAHIKNQDFRIMAIAVMTNFMVVFLSLMALVNIILTLPSIIFGDETFPMLTLMFLVIASILTVSLRLKQSRTREFEADNLAAVISEDPEALISALNKMAHPYWRWVEKLFFVRENESLPLWLRTHPENEERVANLVEVSKSINIVRPVFEIPHFGLIIPKHLREIRHSL